MLPALGALRPWADPEVVAIGRLPMHVPLPVPPAGVPGRRRRSLNGRWRLRLWAHPDGVPASSVRGPYDDWTTATVPGNWTVQDVGRAFGDLPHYTNVRMPFPGPPPQLPERNVTGVYRRRVEVPRGWRSGGQLVLHVGGAESAHAVYVDGAFAGYGTDSRLPSEYDLTALVGDGASFELAVVVLRYSAASYAEDQDQWWMAGLHREVYVEWRPAVHLADVRCAADLDPDGTGLLRVVASVGFEVPTPGYRVRGTLRRPDGGEVGRPRSGEVPHRHAVPYVFTGHEVDLQWRVPRVAAWSAEVPNRYRVELELVGPDGRVVDATHQLVGFRRVEVRDRQLLVNGRRIWVFGVNRHDHHPDRGKAVTVDDMRADLVAMRQHNITAVRTAHYPNDHRFLDLCDELGMYVVDEANIESHAYNTSLCHDPQWRSAWVARGTRMVERDRNHPSVVLWSLGNESGYGPHHDALAAWIRHADPSRPLHYEGAVFHAGWVDGGLVASDVVCPMYAPIDAIRAYGAAGVGSRPLVLCEYSHAMGNSNGSLADYWAAITSTPGLQGGFLWEWKDHGLRQRLPDGTVRLAYGGQFGDTPHDGNFVADGLMSADLQPHPAMREVAWVYRPVTVELRRRGAAQILWVTNRRSFTDLSDLHAEWQLLVDGVIVRRGRLRGANAAPGASVAVPLPCPVPRDGAEVHLTVEWRLRRATPWAAADHLVAWDQVELRPAPPPAPRPAPFVSSLDRNASGGGMTPMGETEVEGVMARPVELTVWRAPTDNDGFKLMPAFGREHGVGGRALWRWLDARLHERPAADLVGHRHTRVVVDATTVEHHHVVDVPTELADLPRVGVTYALPARFSRVRWFGRGPHENYPDRAAGAPLGVYQAAPDRLPYLVPQEFGLRTDCRWFECIDPVRGEVLRVDVLHPLALHCSATHHTAADLFAAATATELQPRRELVVHLDVGHRGLGTASCGPDVLEQYRLPAGRYRFAYRLSLRRAGDRPARPGAP